VGQGARSYEVTPAGLFSSPESGKSLPSQVLTGIGASSQLSRPSQHDTQAGLAPPGHDVGPGLGPAAS